MSEPADRFFQYIMSQYKKNENFFKKIDLIKIVFGGKANEDTYNIVIQEVEETLKMV